jgi:hypothetical protein
VGNAVSSSNNSPRLEEAAELADHMIEEMPLGSGMPVSVIVTAPLSTNGNALRH